MNGKELVHDYFGRRMGWSARKDDPDQYLNINFRADWVGDEIDQHVAREVLRLSRRIVDLEDKIAALEAKLAQTSDIQPIDFASDPLFHVEPPS